MSSMTFWLYFIFHPVRRSSCSMQSFNKKTMSDQLGIFPFKYQMYRNDPKFLDRQVWANSADPDQTAPSVCSGSALFAILSLLFGHITVTVKPYCSNFKIITAILLVCPNRAYPENANCKSCAPSTLKFHILCGLHQTKKCWKYELDTLTSSGVIAIQKYIEHIMKYWECTQGGTNEQFSLSLYDWITVLNEAYNHYFWS